MVYVMLTAGCVHVCRKAISRSGLQHLGPPQPSLPPASNGPNKELRSCLDWTVRIRLRVRGWSQSPTGAGTSLPRLFTHSLQTQLIKKKLVKIDENKKVAMQSGHWRSKVSLLRLEKPKLSILFSPKITLSSSTLRAVPLTQRASFGFLNGGRFASRLVPAAARPHGRGSFSVPVLEKCLLLFKQFPKQVTCSLAPFGHFSLRHRAWNKEPVRSGSAETDCVSKTGITERNRCQLHLVYNRPDGKQASCYF